MRRKQSFFMWRVFWHQKPHTDTRTPRKYCAKFKLTRLPGTMVTNGVKKIEVEKLNVPVVMCRRKFLR